MARTKAVPEQVENEQSIGFDGELMFLLIPVPTYKALSDAAYKRGKTVAKALQEAIDGYLDREA